MSSSRAGVTVSGVVSMKTAEEVAQLAVINKLSRSEMVRKLLEESLESRVKEKLWREYADLEKRLTKIENRFSSLMVKGIRASAQNLYLTDAIVRQYNIDQKRLKELWTESKQFAGEYLKKASGCHKIASFMRLSLWAANQHEVLVMDRQRIDVDKLEREAVAGHGHYVKSVLDQMSFEEQIRVAHEIASLSKERSTLTGCPRIEFYVQGGCGDANSANGYSNIQLYLETHRRYLGPLLPKEELIYESSLNLTTGEKAAADNNR